MMATTATMKKPKNALKSRSQWAEVWRRLKKDRKAMFGLVVLVLLALIAISANWIFDYNKDIVNQNMSQRLLGPSFQHLCGTDEFGRDIFSRILYGTQMSLSIGFMSVFVALVGGVTLGAIAGYYGGKIGGIIMRITDIFSAIPAVLMAIVIVASMGQSLVNLFLSIGIATIPAFVRVTRAQVLTVKDQEYIEAARAIGAKDRTIIISHILPNCLSIIIVQATMSVANSILLSSGLSFLGLGIKAPMPEWGSMLSSGRQFLRGDTWYIAFFPGLAIMITVLALNMLGDGLRDALDPKLKQ